MIWKHKWVFNNVDRLLITFRLGCLISVGSTPVCRLSVDGTSLNQRNRGKDSIDIMHACDAFLIDHPGKVDG